MTTSGYSKGGIEKQVRDAQTILDETHPEMGGTGKTIESLRAELAAAQNKLAHTTRNFESSLNHAEQERKYLSAQLAAERAANAKLRDALTEIATFPRRRMPADIALEALSGEAVPVQQPQP